MNRRAVGLVVLAVLFVGAVGAGVLYLALDALESSTSAATVAPPLPAAPPSSPRAEYLVLPALPPPADLPTIGAPGVDEHGYPRTTVDRVGMLALLRHERYDELTRHMEALQERFEGSLFESRPLLHAVLSFSSVDPRLRPLLDAWVAHSPTSFAPHLARARQREAMGWKHRTTESIGEVAAGQLAAMREQFAAARADAQRAMAHASENPALRTLAAYADGERCDEALRAEDLGAAERHCAAAREAGPLPSAQHHSSSPNHSNSHGSYDQWAAAHELRVSR